MAYFTEICITFKMITKKYNGFDSIFEKSIGKGKGSWFAVLKLYFIEKQHYIQFMLPKETKDSLCSALNH